MARPLVECGVRQVIGVAAKLVRCFRNGLGSAEDDLRLEEVLHLERPVRSGISEDFPGLLLCAEFDLGLEASVEKLAIAVGRHVRQTDLVLSQEHGVKI